jgi:hypothetical protein
MVPPEKKYRARACTLNRRVYLLTDRFRLGGVPVKKRAAILA